MFYTFENNQLTLIDEELGLNYNAAFAPQLLPEKRQEGQLLADGMVVTSNAMKREWAIEKAGVRTGEAHTYDLKGALQTRCFYLEGNLHGPSCAFSPEGQLLAETWFLLGKRVGKSHFYYASGALYALLRYVDGVMEGKQEYYYEEGTLKTVLNYRAGKLEQACLYNRDQSVKREVSGRDL